MNDWSDDDCTKVYADTFITPAPDSDAGIYVLDKNGPPPRWAPRTREKFYGNVISDRGNKRAVYDSTWDQRPMRYNPNAGPGWANLVPPRSARPYGGGPAPSLAYPAEAATAPKELFATAPKELFGADTSRQIKAILVILFVIMLAMVVMSMIMLATAVSANALKEDIRMLLLSKMAHAI